MLRKKSAHLQIADELCLEAEGFFMSSRVLFLLLEVETAPFRVRRMSFYPSPARATAAKPARTNVLNIVVIR